MKQTVGNACGTIGLLHAIGNVTSDIKLRKSPTCFSFSFWVGSVLLRLSSFCVSYVYFVYKFRPI